MSLVDCQTSPGAKAIAAAGYDGALRYLYNLTAAEVQDLHDHGLDLGVIAEHDTTTHHPVLDGASAGKANGEHDAPKLKSLGVPTSTIIWCTADVNVTFAQFATVGAYLDAYRAAVPGYQVGIYGGADLCDWAIVNGHASKGWVAGATSWSHGHTSMYSCLFQKVGTVLGSCDLNVYLNGHTRDTCGLWQANPSPPPPEEDVASTQELIKLADPSKPVYRTHPDGGVKVWVDSEASLERADFELTQLGHTRDKRYTAAGAGATFEKVGPSSIPVRVVDSLAEGVNGVVIGAHPPPTA